MKNLLQALLICATVSYMQPLVLGEEDNGTLVIHPQDEGVETPSNLRGDYDRILSPSLPDDEPDWGLRFNKFQIVQNGGIIGRMLPFGYYSYPLTLKVAQALRRETSAVSVFHRLDTHEFKKMTEYSGITLEYLMTATKVPLLHPSNDPESPFWADLLEVIEAQVARIRNFPVEEWLQLPETWEGYNLTTVAETVRAEFPGSLHSPMIGRLLGGALDRTFVPNPPECAKIDRTIIPSSSSAEFLRG
jgi:hypothetical protein